MAAYLRRECQIPCSIADKLSDAFPPEYQKNSEKWLLLYDAHDCSSDELLDEFQQAKTDSRQPPIMAFFGLVPDIGLEQKALELGVRGFFYIGEEPRTLKKAITALFAGEVWLTRDQMGRCLFETKPHRNSQCAAPITRREEEILLLLRDGKGNYEIAEQLHISYHTVKTHIFHIFKKIGVSSRWEAGIWAAENL